MRRFTSCVAFMVLIAVLFTSCKSSNDDNTTTSKKNASSTNFSSSQTQPSFGPTSKEVQKTMSQTNSTNEAAEFTYPKDTPLVIKKNVETVFHELNTFEFEMTKDAALVSVKRLESVGVKEIAKMQTEISPEGFIHAQIVEGNGEEYWVSFGTSGFIYMIRKGDSSGEIMWAPVF